MKEYTKDGLAEMGRKVVEYRRKRTDKGREDMKLMRQLLTAYREGKIKLPK